MSEQKTVADLRLTVHGRTIHLRRARLTRVRGGWQVADADTGRVVVRRSRSPACEYALPIAERIAAAREERKRRAAKRRLTACGLTIGGMGPLDADVLDAIADLAERGEIVAIDASPKSEAVYLAPRWASLDADNRGPAGAYAGWVRVAQHGAAPHQRCVTVASAHELADLFAADRRSQS